MRRKPRSVRLPMALTMLVFSGLTLALARFDEEMKVTITKPVATEAEPLIVSPGQTIAVEGIADPGDAVYGTMDQGTVTLSIVRRDPTATYGRIHHGLFMAKYDLATKRFQGTVTVSKNPKLGSRLYLEADTVDKAGRHHRGGGVPLVIQSPRPRNPSSRGL